MDGHHYGSVADDVIEFAYERAYDEFGEYVEGFLDSVPIGAKNNLNTFLRDWLNSNAKVTFYGVKDCEKYIITQEDVDAAFKEYGGGE